MIIKIMNKKMCILLEKNYESKQIFFLYIAINIEFRVIILTILETIKIMPFLVYSQLVTLPFAHLLILIKHFLIKFVIFMLLSTLDNNSYWIQYVL